MRKITDKELFAEAIKARTNAYCPYSGFAVGAALFSENGEVFHGCNMENASYGAAICAERSAFSKAISQGARSFSAITIAGGWKDKEELIPAFPCGICRQVMCEFCASKEFKIIVGTSCESLETYTLRELLPHGFALTP